MSMEPKKTVLIVEDEMNIVDIVRFNLQREGYATLEAYDGEAGLALARELGIRREEVVFAMDAVCDPVSLFEPIYSDGGDAVCVMDQVRDTKNTDEDWLEQIALKEAMARLSERERQILALRYSDGKTQMEVSSEIGISQAQVSRLEKNAIKSIKKNM